LTLFNGAPSDNRVALSGAGAQTGGTTSGLTVNPIGGSGALGPGGSASISATLATGLSAQTINQQFTYTFADDSALAGASGNVAVPTITVTGNVYTGQSIWRGRQPFKGSSDGGPFGDLGNPTWTTFGNWGGGAPGLDPNFTTTDAATFGVQTGSVTIDLDGSAPSLNALTFNGVGSYTLMDSIGTGSVKLAGASPVIAVAGMQTISVPLTFATSTSVNVASAGDRLSVTGKPILAAAAILSKTGAGTLEIDAAPTLNIGSTLNVNVGTIKFNVAVGPATVGTGVTATVASGAKLELAGPVSALSSGTNRVAVVNNSRQSLGGELLVSGQNQRVASISGSGDTVVAAGASLTADSIVQNALVIGGTAANPATVAIAPSNESSASTGSDGRNASSLVAPGSFGSAEPFGSAVVGPVTLPSTAPLELPLGSSDSTGASPASASRWNNSSVVPEPSTAALLAFAATVCCLSTLARKRLGALGR
jgi:hypothetical protein